MLPFELKIASKDYPPLVIGAVSIPAYGSVTPNEHIAYNAIVEADSPSELFYFEVLCLFIVSRTYVDLDQAKASIGDIPNHVLQAAFDWVKQEFRAWENSDDDAEKKTQSLIGQESIGDSSLDTLMSPDSIPETSETAQST
jgi:hypothetical protein